MTRIEIETCDGPDQEWRAILAVSDAVFERLLAAGGHEVAALSPSERWLLTTCATVHHFDGARPRAVA